MTVLGKFLQEEQLGQRLIELVTLVDNVKLLSIGPVLTSPQQRRRGSIPL